MGLDVAPSDTPDLIESGCERTALLVACSAVRGFGADGRNAVYAWEGPVSCWLSNAWSLASRPVSVEWALAGDFPARVTATEEGDAVVFDALGIGPHLVTATVLFADGAVSCTPGTAEFEVIDKPELVVKLRVRDRDRGALSLSLAVANGAEWNSFETCDLGRLRCDWGAAGNWDDPVIREVDSGWDGMVAGLTIDVDIGVKASGFVDQAHGEIEVVFRDETVARYDLRLRGGHFVWIGTLAASSGTFTERLVDFPIPP